MCTRIFWNDNPQAKVVARTFDWERSDDAQLWALPRGLQRSGGAGDGSHAWTSRYGSVSTIAWGVVVPEGVNERGLGVHILYLEAAKWERGGDRPALSILLWVQYLLDTCATVAEALDAIEQVRLVSVPVHGRHLGGHLALDDAAGDSAIVEFVDGAPVVHHGREWKVMANDPTYDEQLANLRRYMPFGGDLDLPGDIYSTHRFVRASYFLKHLPEPASAEQAVAGVIGLGRNVSVPFGAPDDLFETYPTWWLSATDLTNRVFYFQSTLAPNVVWVELDGLDLSDGAAARRIDPADVRLAGEIGSLMTPAELPQSVR